MGKDRRPTVRTSNQKKSKWRGVWRVGVMWWEKRLGAREMKGGNCQEGNGHGNEIEKTERKGEKMGRGGGAFDARERGNGGRARSGEKWREKKRLGKKGAKRGGGVSPQEKANLR